ncbi:MAG: CHAT domain-containing protein [Cyanobacteria bacterium J06649_12]
MCISKKPCHLSLKKTAFTYEFLRKYWEQSQINNSHNVSTTANNRSRKRHHYFGRVQIILTTLLWLSIQKTAHSQSIVSSPAGNTKIESSNSEYNIRGGLLSESSNNLFHDFLEFNLTSEETANFWGSASTQNIIGSVSGGTTSFIDGRLQVLGSDANLYLLNPAGILFGTNTQLNLLGSFTAATASHLEFGQNWLTVLGTNDYQALVGEPTGLAFHASSPAPVINTGTLELQSGQTLRLLGGSIINTGSLVNPDGVIDVVAVPGDSTIRITQDGFLLGLDLPQVISDNADSADLLNTLTFTDLPSLLTGGDNDHAVQLLVAEDGSITVQSTEDSSGHLNNLDDQELALVSGSLDVSGEYGGSISILGNNIQLIDSELNANGLQGAGKIRIGGDYRGRRTVPIAERLGVDSNTYINADAINFGSGGSVILWANNQTDFFGTISATGGETSGDGGFAEISSRGSIAINGVVDLSAINGQIGTLLLDPENILIRGDIDPGDADGQLPEILLDEFLNETVTLSQEALENIAETADIVLEATNDIQIGELENNELNLGNDTERIGSISFIADADQDGQGAFIADTDATISTNTRDINISGATITVGSIRTGLQQSGPGGDIDLSAIGDISTGLLGTGEGNVGDIRVVSQQGDITVDSFISTSSGPGDGGSIDVESGGNIFLRENIASLSRERGAGGPIALTGTGANSQIEILGNITFGSSDGISSGALTINTLGDVILEGELINLGGADIAIGNNVSPQTLLLSENISSNGNNVFLRATESLATVDIDTSSNTIGGVIEISSTLGDVNLGNLATNGIENGGEVSLFSGGALNVGFIDTSATPGDGGNVKLGASEDIEVAAVNAQGGVSGGGITVNIDTDQFFRATDTFTDQNGIDASISAAGGAGNGAVNIEHGGLGMTPFIIGDASVNGTAGAITSGLDNTLSPVQVISGSLTFGNINISTEVPDIPVITESTVIPESPEAPNIRIEDSNVPLETPTPNNVLLDNLQERLIEIEKLTRERPAVIYITFHNQEPWQVLRESQEWNPSAKLSITLVLPDTEKPIQNKSPQQDITREEITKIVNNFKASIFVNRAPLKVIEEEGQNLYKSLIKPIEKELSEEGITHISFVIEDPVLQSIPIAAIHDGADFIIRKYSIGLFPTLEDIYKGQYKALTNSDVLAMGISKFEENIKDDTPTGLPSVEYQLKWLKRKESSNDFSDTETSAYFSNVETFLNKEATQENLEKSVSKADIVHIGTHGKLDPRVPNKSYIFLWDRPLNAESFRRLKHQLKNVNLLVLNACEMISGDTFNLYSRAISNTQYTEQFLVRNDNTEAGTIQRDYLFGIEHQESSESLQELSRIIDYNSDSSKLGFAGLAHQLGVQSVIASLTRVQHWGASALTTLFYENLLHAETNRASSKAEAVRQAQLAMLDERVSLDENGYLELYDENHEKKLHLVSVHNSEEKLSHPRFWAGFTLVGFPF